ncbi:DNA-3-methyladenine glycosylase I [Catenovulum maritimum]|uniref:DNA-3-methyladenine glycosylase I n=1 Tax=Catenovulum maritimum TaxID=1513271 RepID=A0A0J8GV89_9ALTE|nr:DNA-3-methyladenine glycosylase I [Catenovulum maritimum]KMT66652.1 DNA-3-methyladenine glycosylase [Catenovulum maritimum]
MTRCDWALASELETKYHDEEWGIPVHDDQKLFEMLILEGAQAGLSWSTILNKREGYRQAFDNFEPNKVAQYSPEKIAELLQNPAIVRNKLKVNATVTNAKLFLQIQQEYGSFNQYIWSFVGHTQIINKWKCMQDVPATSAESDAMSKDLKKRGFKFVGSTICYAYMQAVGMVNDHLTYCEHYTNDNK